MKCVVTTHSFILDVRFSMLLPDAEFEVLIEKIKELCSGS